MSSISTPSSPASVPAVRHASQIVRQFTPNWFTVTMGTGILSLALNQAPFVTPTLSIFAEDCGC
jgi:Voltage-dependent anion channel